MSGWHPASHFCLTKERTEPGTVFCVFSHAGILDRVMWARQVTDGTFAPMRCARAGGSSLTRGLPWLYVRLRWLQEYGLGAQLLGWTRLELTRSLSNVGDPCLAYHSSESSLDISLREIPENLKLLPTRIKNSQH